MPSSVASLIDTHFPGFLGIKLSKKRKCVEAVLLYMFRGINAKDLNAALDGLCGNKKAFRIALRDSGYLFKVKMLLFYCAANGIKSSRDPQVGKLLNKFMVHGEDAKLIQFVNKTDTLRLLLRAHAKKYTVMTLQQFRHMLGGVSNEVEVSAIKYARKKMTFISRSNGFDIHDLSTELLCNSIQAVMSMYPCIESPLHAQNIMKREIHNSGVNAILHYTTQSRGTLVREKDGTFTSLKVSYDSLVKERYLYAVNDVGADSSGMSSMQFGEESDPTRDVVSDTIAATQLLAAHKGKKQKLLYLMTGEVNARFTRYLRKNKLVRVDKDNEDFFHVLSKKDGGMDTYIEHAMDFLNIEHRKGQRFLKRLRTNLGGISA